MRAALSFLVVPLVLGCGTAAGAKKADVAGKWKVDPAFVANPPQGVQKALAAVMEKQFAFEFKPDGTFAFPGEIAGTYTVEGNTVSITTTKIGGQEVPAGKDNPPMVGTMSEDGTKMTMAVPSSSYAPVTVASVPMIRDK